MARGWESKAVEAQQAEATQKSNESRPRLTPEAAALQREREGLELLRRRVLQQLEGTGNSRHRQLLQDSLAELDKKLKAIEA